MVGEFGDKKQGSVLMHAQVIKLRLVTIYNIKVINEFNKIDCQAKENVLW